MTYFNPYSIKVSAGPYLEYKQNIDPQTGSSNSYPVKKGLSAAAEVQGTIQLPSADLLSAEVFYKTYRGKGPDKHEAYFLSSYYLFSANDDNTAFVGPQFGLRRLPATRPQWGLGISGWLLPVLKYTCTSWSFAKKDLSFELELNTGLPPTKQDQKNGSASIAFTFRFDQGYNPDTRDEDTLLCLGLRITHSSGWGVWWNSDNSWLDTCNLGVEKTSFKESYSAEYMENRHIERTNRLIEETIAATKELLRQIKLQKKVDSSLSSKACDLTKTIDSLLEGKLLMKRQINDLRYLKTLLSPYIKSKN